MCSHFQAPPKPEIYSQAFGVTPPADLGKHDVWPGYLAGFIPHILMRMWGMRRYRIGKP